MANPQSPGELENEIETALIDADLFVKYKAPERAIGRLRTAIGRHPRSIPLRERLREIAVACRHPEEAARQCLALASLYIERDNFDAAHDRLLEARQLDERINIAPGLEAIRRARRPELQQDQASRRVEIVAPTFSGDLSAISIFDVIQVLENARLTGALNLTGHTATGRVLFNEGIIAGAETAGLNGVEAFRSLVEIAGGAFDFERSTEPFAQTISAASNTNLILDSLRQLDEART